jgi:hypothetical protein
MNSSERAVSIASMTEPATAFRVGDEVVVDFPEDGRAFLQGEVTAFKGRNAIIKLTSPHRSDALSGSWLRVTRGDGLERWHDPASLVDVRLYERPPRLQHPWGNRQLSTSAMMRRRPPRQGR